MGEVREEATGGELEGRVEMEEVNEGSAVEIMFWLLRPIVEFFMAGFKMNCARKRMMSTNDDQKILQQM